MNPSTRLMIAKLRDLATAGRSYSEAAAELGVAYSYVAGYASKYGIPFALRPRGRKKLTTVDPRAEAMRDRYIAGETLECIAKDYGITRERVRQIIYKHFGIRAADGGKSAQARAVRKEFDRKRDARLIRKWGCTYKQYRMLLDHPGRPTYAYWGQRRNAESRGIGWELTLWQWWKLWEQSGHWSERGRGRGYHMCRLNDIGPYSVDNVYIATGTENMKDFWVNKRAAELAA